MPQAATPRWSVFSFRVLATLTVVHALAVLAIWLSHSATDLGMISGQTWTLLAWLWLIWPFAMLLHPAGSLRRAFLPLFLGVLMLAPCAATVFLFTAWAVQRNPG